MSQQTKKMKNLPVDDVLQLVHATLQLGKDRNVAHLKPNERDLHLDAAVNAAVAVALELGIDLDVEEPGPDGQGPSGGNYV